MPASGPGRALLGLAILGAAGLLIRAGAAATARIWFDEATTGLMGRGVLHGQFPSSSTGSPSWGRVPHGLLTTRGIGLAALAVFGAALVLALGDRRGDRAGRPLLSLATAMSLAAVLVTERGQTLAELGGLELHLGVATFEYPRGLTLQVDRGSGWEDVRATVRWVGPLVWAGTHVLRAGVERVVVTSPRARVRTLRIVQTGTRRVPPMVGGGATPARALTTCENGARVRAPRVGPALDAGALGTPGRRASP